MRKKRKWLILLILPVLFYALAPQLVLAERFGFSRAVSPEEGHLRMKLVDTACGWAGAREEDGSHQAIIDLYNTLDPLPQDYHLTYDDAWCAAFVSAAALEAGLTDILPPECSCARQIRLFQTLDRWEENDAYSPLPGDILYYDWDFSWKPNCTGWPEHVGIVVGTCGPFIRVIEGNKDGLAAYRTIWRNDWCIRGYGLPDYVSK